MGITAGHSVVEDDVYGDMQSTASVKLGLKHWLDSERTSLLEFGLDPLSRVGEESGRAGSVTFTSQF